MCCVHRERTTSSSTNRTSCGGGRRTNTGRWDDVIVSCYCSTNDCCPNESLWAINIITLVSQQVQLFSFYCVSIRNKGFIPSNYVTEKNRIEANSWVSYYSLFMFSLFRGKVKHQIVFHWSIYCIFFVLFSFLKVVLQEHHQNRSWTALETGGIYLSVYLSHYLFMCLYIQWCS